MKSKSALDTYSASTTWRGWNGQAERHQRWSNFPPLVVVRENVDHGVPVKHHTRESYFPCLGDVWRAPWNASMYDPSSIERLSSDSSFDFSEDSMNNPSRLESSVQGSRFLPYRYKPEWGGFPPFFLAYLEFWMSAKRADDWQASDRVTRQMVGYHSWRRLISEGFRRFFWLGYWLSWVRR